ATVAQSVAAFAGSGGERADAVAVEEAHAEAALLNGPQHPTVAMDQSDIDKLLASFDAAARLGSGWSRCWQQPCRRRQSVRMGRPRRWCASARIKATA